MSNESTEEILTNRKQEVLRAVSDALNDFQILIKANPKKGHIGPRSSKFRGVSLNGKKWQTLVMGFKKKAYRGRHNTEIEAAVDYDKNSILSQGLNVSCIFPKTHLTLMNIGKDQFWLYGRPANRHHEIEAQLQIKKGLACWCLWATLLNSRYKNLIWKILCYLVIFREKRY